MLKIKDNVDLKELEKFGFEEYVTYWHYNKTNYDLTLYVIKSTRKVIIHSGEYGDCEDGKSVEPKLYDLIKADLVEKV